MPQKSHLEFTCRIYWDQIHYKTHSTARIVPRGIICRAWKHGDQLLIGNNSYIVQSQDTSDEKCPIFFPLPINLTNNDHIIHVRTGNVYQIY